MSRMSLWIQKTPFIFFFNYHINHLKKYSCIFFYEEKNFKGMKTNRRGWFCFRDFFDKAFYFFFLVEHLSCCFYHSLLEQNCKAIFHLFSYGYLGYNLLDRKIPFFYFYWDNDRLLRAKKAKNPKSIRFCNTFREYTFVLCKYVLFLSNLIYI